MSEETYKGPERRRFRRIELECPVRIETVGKAEGAAPGPVFQGITANLSFGGALMGVTDTSELQGAVPVSISFSEARQGVRPPDLTAVVWRLENDPEAAQFGVEFDEPLLAFDGSLELEERLAWLSKMGGEEFRDDIVGIFLDNVPETLFRAAESERSGDLAGVVHAARSVKSSAADVGAVSLYELARRVEQAAFQGDVTAVAQIVGRLDEYFEAVKTQLERLRSGRR